MTIEYQGTHDIVLDGTKKDTLASFTFSNHGVNLVFSEKSLKSLFSNRIGKHLTFEEQVSENGTVSYQGSADSLISPANAFDPFTQKTYDELFAGTDQETIRAEFNKALNAMGRAPIDADTKCQIGKGTPTASQPKEEHSADIHYLPNAIPA